jgi:MarR family transcriptional regulator for hemolysin
VADRLNSFGFLLRDVSRRYVLRFERHAADISLTLVQCRALAHLEKNEGISQARLAELTEVEPMAMVRILDRMEAEGVLERRLDPDDRRARRLYLTTKAGPVLDEIWRLAALTRAETFAGVARAEREVFIGVLERLDANLSVLDAQDDPAARAASRPPALAAGGKGRTRRLPTKQEP